jgi:glucose-1-phosphate thymidylyltransferase
MKGIVLAGGSGTRLHPATLAVSKQLLPVHDKPMIYYPLATLLEAGVRDILLISTPHDLPLFERLLGDGSRFGVRLSYAEQARPEGIAQALLLGEAFLAGEGVTLVLGDNLFFGQGVREQVQRAIARESGATIFAYAVRDPERYGVVELAPDGEIVSLEEKPTQPRSRLAITGLYVYDTHAVEVARSLVPSARGELEITDVNLTYWRNRTLRAEVLGRGVAWLDTGTHESLLQASTFIHALEERQGVKIACLEAIALTSGWITPREAEAIGRSLAKTPYGQYLLELVLEREGVLA